MANPLSPRGLIQSALILFALTIGGARADEPPGHRSANRRPATLDSGATIVSGDTACNADRGIYVAADGSKFVADRYGVRPWPGGITYAVLAGTLNGRRVYFIMGSGPTGTGWAESAFASDRWWRSQRIKWTHEDVPRADKFVPVGAIAGGPLAGRNWPFRGCRE
jgi:hypothetical protein